MSRPIRRALALAPIRAVAGFMLVLLVVVGIAMAIVGSLITLREVTAVDRHGGVVYAAVTSPGGLTRT